MGLRSAKKVDLLNMGMPCEVNSLLKLTPSQGYPTQLEHGQRYQAQKEGYRIIPVDVPIPLVDRDWFARADIQICRLVWENGMTNLEFEIVRIYPEPMLTKEL